MTNSSSQLAYTSPKEAQTCLYSSYTGLHSLTTSPPWPQIRSFSPPLTPHWPLSSTMLGARSRELANGSLKALGDAWGDGFTIAMTGASSRELADGSLRALGEAWGASSTIAIAWSEFLMPRLALPSLSGSGWLAGWLALRCLAWHCTGWLACLSISVMAWSGSTLDCL